MAPTYSQPAPTSITATTSTEYDCGHITDTAQPAVRRAELELIFERTVTTTHLTGGNSQSISELMSLSDSAAAGALASACGPPHGGQPRSGGYPPRPPAYILKKTETAKTQPDLQNQTGTETEETAVQL